MIFKIDITKVNGLLELERAGIKYTPSGSNEVKFLCPSHQDSDPSCFLNTEKNLWNCKGCGISGDIISLLAIITSQTRSVIVVHLCKTYNLRYTKEISGDIVESLHEKITKSGPLLTELYKRGITDEMIKKARIGFSEKKNRLTIPVYDIERRIIDIRYYLPGGKEEKMRSTKSYGGVHLYQPEQTNFDTIWITGGEIKALASSYYLNQHGVGAISTTAGEGSWHKDFTPLIANKLVYICMDIDPPGVNAAICIAKQIFSFCKQVKIIKLPLDIIKYPHGDINDYIGIEKKTDLIDLMSNHSYIWHPQHIEVEEETVVELPLIEATNAENIGKRIAVEGVITSMDSTPYLVPRNLTVSCSRDQGFCSICPIKQKRCNEATGEVDVEIPSCSKGIIEIINISKKLQREGILIGLGIPPMCKIVKYTPKTYWTILDVRLTPQIKLTHEASQNVNQPAYCICRENLLQMNVPYKMTGKVLPRPQTQQAVMLMDSAILSEDSLDTFKCENLEELNIFKCNPNIDAKLKDIYTDFEKNVTKIYERKPLHFLIDLCYHSPLRFKLDGEEINGWINLLILGDSSQGKTKTIKSLMAHYGLGERVECKNATVAGLLGGLHQMGSRWFASWGVIPTHDRRLVILEEIKGAKPEVIAALTDMRSEGIAMLPKIEKQKAFARTRLICVSNPKSGKNVESYSFGTDAIKELIPGLEDIRRFDTGIVVATDEVDRKLINKISTEREEVPHKYTSKLCQTLILWIWTRKAEQVIFEEDALKEIFESAVRFTDKYTEMIPIVDRGTIRHKLARLSAALAGRLFSTNDMESIIVKKEHVVYIELFLNRVYDTKAFGYKEYSISVNYANKLLDPKGVSQYLISNACAKELIDGFLYGEQITLQDIQDWGNISDLDTAKRLLSFLVRKHALYRQDRYYSKTPGFIELLREIDTSNLHVQKEEEKF